jgi:hypothetical protein
VIRKETGGDKSTPAGFEGVEFTLDLLLDYNELAVVI